MKLVKCHIEGFGKLRDRQIDFEEGINVICENNGFGKTTLATFLKTMFYGFEDETKRNLKDKEREKFRPWDKGSYGGSLVFETNGKTYEVSRSFGKNAADDSFELRDYSTNAVSKDFSKENMGAEIFGIDRASFFRTAYFASKDRDLSTECITDSIRAKLGNLSDATDDINNYESVCTKIDNLKNEYSPDRKTGKIKGLKTKISELGNEIRGRSNIDKSIEILENQIVSEHAKLDRNKKKIGVLKEEAKKASEAFSKKAKRETYDTLKSEYEESAKSAKSAVSIFTNRIPTHNEIDTVSAADMKNRHLLQTLNANRPRKDEEWERIDTLFKDNLPKENEIADMLSVWNEREELSKKADNLLKCREDSVAKYVEAEKKKIERDNEDKLKEVQSENATKKRKLYLFSSIAAICLVISIAGALLTKGGEPILHIVLTGVFILFSALFALFIPIMQLYRQIEFEKKEADIEELIKLSANSPEVSEIEQRIAANKEVLFEKENSVRDFVERYNQTYDEKTVNVSLFKISEDYKAYTEGTKKIAEYEATRKEYDETEDLIEKFFENVGTDEDGNREETINRMREALLKKEQFEKETERKRIILDNFEADNDIEELLKEEDETVKDREDIEEETADIEEENDVTKARIENFRMKLSEEQEKREEILSKESQEEELKEKLEEYEEFYRLMGLTEKYLKEAKDALSMKYTGPTMKAFKKYCMYFDANEDEFRIDTNFNLTKVEEGMQRDLRDMSFGFRDVSDFCLRLAFSDAMYEDEKPFLIMDDPFVNFDAGNLEAARKVLDRVQNDYQVIYFTCHESRGGM